MSRFKPRVRKWYRSVSALSFPLCRKYYLDESVRSAFLSFDESFLTFLPA